MSCRINFKEKTEEKFFNDLILGDESILYRYREKIKLLVSNELLKQ